MPYQAPVTEFEFLMKNVVDMAAVAGTDIFAEASAETVHAILTEAAKLSEEVLAPLNRNGDLHPAHLENGVVRTSPGYADGFKAIAEGGYIAMSADPEFGGLGLPITLTTAVNEMMSSACLSLQLAPLMSQGQIEALEHHASDEIKARYLPKLISGEWLGTMNLTEPQAGSDVGALTSRAEPQGDGTYAITGQKIYISWGDNDFTENVCHLVLARLPDAPKGSKGISLFLVPKRLLDDDGQPGVANTLKVVSLEHKLGLHGSPTAVMQYDGAQGWMIGAPGGGLAAMFTMMNNARLGVGVQGVGVAEAAFQHALAYATDRRQGRAMVENGTGTIVDHADVRRMLSVMKAEVFAARALTLDLAVSLDLARAGDDPKAQARAALLTPLAKTYGTETGMSVAQSGIQVHGGMGFIEETGAAQYLRDVRVTAIYEGTNGIQAMDLVGRKLADGGEALRALLGEVEATVDAADEALAKPLRGAVAGMRGSLEAMLKLEMNDRAAGAMPFLMALARVLGAHYHVRAATADPARSKLARIYLSRALPQAHADMAAATIGASDLYDLSPEDLAA
ncbi:MAG: acyl-CoA dehydrogenase [Pseudomonadota bacterium]